MATNASDAVIPQLRRFVLFEDGGGLTDASLLGRFIEKRDEDAFEGLMRRHGPMVLGVCRRILPNPQDTEDAFQATFLVLVRKAASVRPREMVGNWLYGVAHQTAIRVRGLNAKRRGREQPMTTMPEPQAEAVNSHDDLHQLLDRELSRLPDKYRVAIVLCDLEGKTRPEAARQLGWPEGSVASRLARGRALLVKRLTKQGLALSVAALAAHLSQNAAAASLPATLASSTIKAAGLSAAGQTAATGLISANVAAITEGVLKAMLLTKLKIATILAAMTLTCGGVYLVGHSPSASGQNLPDASAPANGADATPPAKDSEPKDVKGPAQKGDAMFPDGRDQDFGILLNGQTVTRVLRVANTTPNSMKLASVRTSCGCVTCSVSSKPLGANEEGTLAIAVDSSRFRGPKTITLFLRVERSGAAEEYRLTISANSQTDRKGE
jgi:RNA polymerase sigma factor (sigma-70 family)